VHAPKIVFRGIGDEFLSIWVHASGETAQCAL